jgi:hypothetical protein
MTVQIAGRARDGLSNQEIGALTEVVADRRDDGPGRGLSLPGAQISESALTRRPMSSSWL